MVIGSRVDRLQMLGLFQERLAQPFGRHSRVIALVLVLSRLWDLDIFIGPVLRGPRRVEVLEYIRFVTATDCTLLYGSHLLWTMKTVQLLEPQNTNIPEWRLD